MSLLLHDSDSLDCVHYISNVFDTNTGICWHCDVIYQKDFILEIFTKNNNNKKESNVRIKIYIVCDLYQDKPSDIIYLCLFSNSITYQRFIIWRKYCKIGIYLGAILGLDNMVVMKFEKESILLKMRFKLPLKPIYLVRIQNLFWLKRGRLKNMLTMNPMGKHIIENITTSYNVSNLID